MQTFSLRLRVDDVTTELWLLQKLAHLSLSHADNVAHLRGRALKLGYWHLHRTDRAFGCRLRFFVAVRTADNGLDIAAVLLVDLSSVLLLEGG